MNTSTNSTSTETSTQESARTRRFPKRYELKCLLKNLAAEIRKAKAAHKEAQRKGTADWRTHGAIVRLRMEYRTHHIAYSMLRGRTLDQIENKHRKTTPEIAISTIQAIMEKYKDAPIATEAA